MIGYVKIVSNLMPIGGRPGKRERISTSANNDVASQLKAVIVGGRRPPTLTALSWLATSLFALVEIRSRFPGRPPMGIKLDTIFTYPIIAILLFLIVLHTYLWVKRDDWNMKNVYSNQE